MDSPSGRYKEIRDLRESIRKAAINRAVGQFVRVIGKIADRHEPESIHPEREAEIVVKQALMLMSAEWLDSDGVTLLVESSKLRLPKWIEESSAMEIKNLIREDDDRPPSTGH